MSLAEALDRILHRGVSLQGNLTIGLADVDLLFLDLRVLLGLGGYDLAGRPSASSRRCAPNGAASARVPGAASARFPAAALRFGQRRIARSRLRHAGGGPPIAVDERHGAGGSSTAQGLVRLVLTLVKLLHDVLERQAVRRMEAGRLTDAQIENLGTALFAQAEEILRLQRQFGFSEKDLSLDLGVPEGAL